MNHNSDLERIILVDPSFTIICNFPSFGWLSYQFLNLANLTELGTQVLYEVAFIESGVYESGMLLLSVKYPM